MDEEGWKAIIYTGIKHDSDPDLFRRQLEQMKKTDEAGLKRLLSTGTTSPLIEAARLGRKELVGILLECGADTRAKDHENDTAVHIAAEYDMVEVLKTLLEYDGDAIKESGFYSQSPLQHAMRNSSWDAFTYILENHSPECFSWNPVPFFLLSHPLHYASLWFPPANSKGEKYTSGEMVREFLKKGCPNEYNGEHLVIHAARTGDIDVLKNLVDHADPTKSDLRKTKEVLQQELKGYRPEILTYLAELDRILNEETPKVERIISGTE